MINQLKHHNYLSLQRYSLTLPYKLLTNQQYPKAYVNHSYFWSTFSKVVIHSTSKKLLNTPELYGPLSLAFSCMSTQTPIMVKSKMSVSAFKVMSGSLIGSKSHLRGNRLTAFCYKWTFLSAAVEDLKGQLIANSLGLRNLFVFELDQLDYRGFEPLSGLEIGFDSKPTNRILRFNPPLAPLPGPEAKAKGTKGPKARGKKVGGHHQ